MPNYELQTTLHTVSQLSADFSTNTWTIIADDDASAFAAIPYFSTFYDQIVGLFSGLTSQGTHTHKMYRRADLPPRAPILEDTWSFTTAPAGNSFPTEVALCLSFEGAQVSGIPQARRRGRVYLGPFDTGTGGVDARPSATTLTTVQTAALNLFQASQAALNWSWGIFSPTSNSAVPVTHGWIDNEWDTQRRRGRDAVTRVTFV